MSTKTILTLSIISATLLLSGCGSSSSDDYSASISGQFVDNYVKNVDYTCADGKVGVTDENGTFECQNAPVKFHLGGLELGTINSVAQDKQVLPQDLLGVERTDVNNTEVIAMARLLQSCDEDNNTKNGIAIKAQIKEIFKDKNETFNHENLQEYATDADIELIDEEDAIAHLQSTTTFIENVNHHISNQGEDSKEGNGSHQENGSHGDDAHEGDGTSQGSGIPQVVLDALLTPASQLTQEAKNTLAYMGNEERLAYDVYMQIYNTQLQVGEDIKQLYNIANNAEVNHAASVGLLVEKYISSLDEFTNIDANVTQENNMSIDLATKSVTDLPTGIYNIETIQNLYNVLTQKGAESKQDALEVGCMVEVTDIEDLLHDIEIAKDSNASDVVTVFEYLRDGSYNHYWSFDKGLKNMGVNEGCCVLGELYCHPEYPQK